MPEVTWAQTCCSGGVPISNSLGLPFLGQKALQINLSYDYNRLHTLMQDSERIDDDSRTRLTHTALLQLGLGLSSKLSLEVLVPYIEQDRRITQLGSEDNTSTSGLGDISTLLSYIFLIKLAKQTLYVGFGFKAPTGAIDNKNNQGIALNSDMQPGTGAWDLISMIRFVVPFKSNSFYANLIINFKGTDKDYQPDFSNTFGDEQ